MGLNRENGGAKGEYFVEFDVNAQPGGTEHEAPRCNSPPAPNNHRNCLLPALAMPGCGADGSALGKSIRVLQGQHVRQSDERPNPFDLRSGRVFGYFSSAKRAICSFAFRGVRPDLTLLRYFAVNPQGAITAPPIAEIDSDCRFRAFDSNGRGGAI